MAQDDELEILFTLEKPSCDDLINIFPDPFVIIDRYYQIVASNKAYQDHYRFGSEINGRFCYEVSHHYDSPCSQHGEHCPLETVMRTGKMLNVLHIHKHGDKEEHVQISANPIHASNGEIRYMAETLVTINEPDSGPQLLVGRSPSLLKLKSILHRVAPTQSTVFIEGESGVGKDCVANYIHHYSNRNDQPFIVVDCGAIGATLIESELFGYEKGSFTGAIKQSQGLIEAANGGTLFVDEIGELSLDLQTKLLRVLETGTIRRIGGTKYIKVDVRIIAATNRNVKDMVQNGKFRQDLYYRLATFPVHIPPLRDRKDDIPVLAEHFLSQIEGGQRHIPLDPNVISFLLSYDYPGNIRELRNIIERAVILAADDLIDVVHLTIDKNITARSPDFTNVEVDDFPGIDTHMRRSKPSLERIEKTLEQFDGHRLLAARALGISERTLYRHLAKKNK